MESGVTVNIMSGEYPCYEADNFNHTVKPIPSIMCVLLYIVLILFTIITICGNVLVIIAIIYFKQLHTPTNYLIVSLAAADLLIGIIVCPFTMAFSETACLYSTEVVCKVRSLIDTSLTTCSIMNLGCISIDRYYAVCHPLTYRTKMSHHVVAIMILFSWGFTAVTIVFGLFSNIYGASCGKSCIGFVFMLLLIAFVLPVIIMMCNLCIYLKIFIVAQRQVRSIQNTTCQSTKSEATVSKMERKATKTLAIVLGFFLVCWIPFFLCSIIDLASNLSTPMRVPVIVYETLNWIKLSNSMFNPFIYAFFYSWFRSAFRTIISRKIFQGNFTNSQLY